MSKKTPTPAPTSKGGGSTLGKLVVIAGLGIVAVGFMNGDITLPALGSGSSATPAQLPAAAAKHTGGSSAGIPSDYLALYKAHAGGCKGLDWSLLAGVGFVESDHGRSPLPGVHSGANKAGAKGPMQFKDPTWAETRGFDPSIGADVYDPGNAIKGAATYLCHYAASKGLTGALSQYGGGGGYAGKVTSKAAEYRKAS